MIYTVTFNPSLDYVVRVTEFELGNLHRAHSEDLFVGGKGINVSTVLHRLGVESVALGFAAGFTGNEIIRRLNDMGITSDFIVLEHGISRINMKLKTGDNLETEINGQGPDISQIELEYFFDRLCNLQRGDFLVLSGSVPKSLSNAELIYSEICSRVEQKGIRLIIDAEGDLLRNTLINKPFLIKPNLAELEKLFGQVLTSEQEIIYCARKLQKEGAINVMISLAGDGAILVDEHGIDHKQPAPKGKVVNSVGAGDSMIAGFLAYLAKLNPEGEVYFQSEDYKNALIAGVAAGSAGAFSAGLPDKFMIDQVYQEITANLQKLLS